MNGQLDLEIGWFIWKHCQSSGNIIKLRVGILKVFLSHGSAFDEAINRLEKSDLSSFDEIKVFFMDSLTSTKKAIEFINFLESHLIFFLKKSNGTFLKKIVKYLFLAINVYKEQAFQAAFDLLSKFLTKDIFAQTNAKKLFLLDLNNIKNITNLGEDKVCLLMFPCLNTSQTKRKCCFHMVVSGQIFKVLSENTLDFCQITVLNKDLKVEAQYNYFKEKDKTRDIIAISGKEMNKEEIEQETKITNNNLLVKILDDPTVCKSSLLEISHLLDKNNNKLFWKLSFKKLVIRNNEKCSEFGGKKIESQMLTYKTLKFLKKLIFRTIKKYGISGIMIGNFLNCLEIKRLEYQQFSNMSQFKEKLEECKENEKLKPILLNSDIVGPFYLAILRKLQLQIPGFQFFSSELPNLSKIGFKYLLQPFSKTQIEKAQFYNLMNFLNNSLEMTLRNRNIFENAMMSQKHSENPFKEALLKKFYQFIRDKLPFYVVSKKDDIFFRKMSTDLSSIENQHKIQSFDQPVYYFSLNIQESSHNNSIIGCAIVAKNRIMIFLEKFFEIENADCLFKISLINIYQYLKQLYPKEQRHRLQLSIEGKNNTLYFNFYEFFKNPLRLQFQTPKFFYDIEIHEPKIISKEKIIFNSHFTQNGKNDVNYYVIKNCLFCFKNSVQTNLEKSLKKFVKIFKEFKIQNLENLSQLFKLRQIFERKKNYEIFTILLKSLIDQYDLFQNELLISKQDLVSFFNSLKINKIGVITPEYGEFVKVGGLGVMIEDLCNGLAAEGEQMIVVLPYYNQNKSGNTNYLSSKKVQFLFSMIVSSRYENYNIGVHCLVRNNITFYFLHHYYLFPVIYTSVGLLDR